jgi:hypothetical protein
MKLFALAVAMSVSPPVFGEETKSLPQQPLQLRPKASLATVASPAPVLAPKNAPFISAPAAAPEPGLDLVSPRSQASSQAKPGCSKAASLCYEADTGRIVFKPARQFMPDIPGLQRENISLKRDRIIFRYSF